LLGSIVAAAGVGLTGCSGRTASADDRDPATDVDGSETESTGRTATPTETATRTVTPRRPDDCPTTMGLDIEKPDELTPESVAAFVVAYEEAYLRAEEIPDGVEDGDVRAYDPTATRLGAGYAVEVEYRYGWCGRRPWGETPTGDGATPTEVCVDEPGASAVYYVDPVVVRRTRRHRDEPRKGELLECRDS
jgi:hypothetical protein